MSWEKDTGHVGVGWKACRGFFKRRKRGSLGAAAELERNEDIKKYVVNVICLQQVFGSDFDFTPNFFLAVELVFH